MVRSSLTNLAELSGLQASFVNRNTTHEKEVTKIVPTTLISNLFSSDWIFLLCVYVCSVGHAHALLTDQIRQEVDKGVLS